ncbi:MAG TPA: RNA polymerase sigma factor [Bacteroidales bacterium]|jgi:RNA polymerase sigma-70 factor (ECF subfamily)|nr:RNA polymerase sigma factor [Bacteroidales bacterium]
MDYKGDIELIEQVLEGKTDAFSLIIDHHKNRVFNLAMRICGNREDAEEIAQDSFLKAYNGLGSFRMKSSFSTWLYRIVYNTAVSFLRTRKKGILSLEEFPAEMKDFAGSSSGDDEAEKDYRSSLVNFALQKISEDERVLISLYYYEELETDEIASITGISRSNVKVKLFRARQKMLEIIEKTERRKTIYQ